MTDLFPNTATDKTEPTRKSWRNVLPIHPAADKIPAASDDERQGIALDLSEHGLKVPVVLVRVAGGPPQLLDGRHRLDLLEGTGIKVVSDDGSVLVKHEIVDVADDAEAERLSLSLNVHRRHLSIGDKRKLIVGELMAAPEKSNRQIAEQVKDDHKKVGRIREALEATGAVPQLTKTTGRDGKARPAKISARTRKPDTKAAKLRPGLVLGNAIIRYREEHKLSQGDFAEKLGASEYDVSRWERGHGFGRTIKAMLKDLGIVATDATTEVEPKEPTRSQQRAWYGRTKQAAIQALGVAIEQRDEAGKERDEANARLAKLEASQSAYKTEKSETSSASDKSSATVELAAEPGLLGTAVEKACTTESEIDPDETADVLELVEEVLGGDPLTAKQAATFEKIKKRLRRRAREEAKQEAKQEATNAETARVFKAKLAPLVARLIAADVARALLQALTLHGPYGGVEGYAFFLVPPLVEAIEEALERVANGSTEAAA